jgi:predicted O-methyltransferase YrrM
MTHELWTAIDDFFDQALLPSDPVLDAAREASVAAGLPQIAVAPNQGRFLQILAQIQGARRILEMGTLGAYSTIWLARALPEDGHLISLEVDPKHAEVARDNIANAGLDGVAEVRLGPALETLPKLLAEDAGPFDLIFIDADKPNNAAYFEWAVRLSRPGTLIIVDNVVRGGKVIDPPADDPDSQGVQRLNEVIAAEPRVSATTLQTVGRKGHDGFTVALVK